MELEPLQQFCYLSELSAVCSISNLEMLLNLLKSCPKLESLSLVMNCLTLSNSKAIFSEASLLLTCFLVFFFVFLEIG